MLVLNTITVSSGTDSLLIALMALGIGAGDEVITVPYTWISTAEVIALLGAKPVFVDIRPDTWNMDEQLLESSITEKTKAIMPVSIYGQCPEMDTINSIARKYSLPVIEDAAQSFEELQRKKSVIYLPSEAHHSSHQTTWMLRRWRLLLPAMMNLLKSLLIAYGQERKHHHPILGLNGRMDTLQSAILLEILELFPDEVTKRQEIAEVYMSALSKVSCLKTPIIGRNNSSVYAQYTILSEKREQIQKLLKEQEIPSVSYYSVPLHLQPVFAGLGHKEGDFPVSEMVANQCLSLPMSPNLAQNDQSLVTECIINGLA